MRNAVLTLFLPFVVAACDPVQPPKSAPPAQGPQDTCGAAPYEYLRGQPRSAVEALSFTQPMRIIPHDGAVTLDYLPERINFGLNKAGKVIAITCG